MLLSSTLVLDFTLYFFFAHPPFFPFFFWTERNTRRELERQLQQEQGRRNQQEQLTQQLIQENETGRNTRMALERELEEQNERERIERQETQQQLRVMEETLSGKQQENDRLQEELEQLHQEMETERNVARTRARDQEQERNRRMALERELRQERQETEQQRREMGENLSRKQQENDRLQAELEQLRQEMEEERNAARTRARDQEQEQADMRIELANLRLQDEEVNGAPDWILSQEEIQITSKTLGEGAWATVNEGIFRGSRVAVKRMHRLILSPYNVRLFEREMVIAARCRHPNLLQFIGATKENRQAPLIVMEILETSLRSVLEERELEPEEVITISLDVARALNYLHLNKPSPIIHRDLSSANVLLWRHGNAWRGKVSDYGTANFMKECTTINPGAVVYSAPEAQTTNQSPKVSYRVMGIFFITVSLGVGVFEVVQRLQKF